MQGLAASPFSPPGLGHLPGSRPRPCTFLRPGGHRETAPSRVSAPAGPGALGKAGEACHQTGLSYCEPPLRFSHL